MIRGSCAREKIPSSAFKTDRKNVINDLRACNVSDSGVSLYILFLYQSLLKCSKLSAVQFNFSCVFVHLATYCELTQSMIKYFIIQCSFKTRRERQAKTDQSKGLIISFGDLCKKKKKHSIHLMKMNYYLPCYQLYPSFPSVQKYCHFSLASLWNCTWKF